MSQQPILEGNRCGSGHEKPSSLPCVASLTPGRGEAGESTQDLAQDHILHALPQTNEAGSQAFWGFPGGSAVKNPPVMEETWVQSLGREDPLEKGMATHSSILTWEIPWTEEPDGLQSTGSQRVRYNLATEHAHYQEVGRLKPNNKIHFKNAI